MKKVMILAALVAMVGTANADTVWRTISQKPNTVIYNGPSEELYNGKMYVIYSPGSGTTTTGNRSNSLAKKITEAYSNKVFDLSIYVADPSFGVIAVDVVDGKFKETSAEFEIGTWGTSTTWENARYAVLAEMTNINGDGSTQTYLYEAHNLTGAFDGSTSSKSSGNFTAGSGSWNMIPEPTSGLLMLIGMAGLALKRKRA